MKKKIVIIISVILVIILIAAIGGVIGYNKYQQYRIDNAVKIVKLSKEQIDVFDEVYLKNIIEEINGKLIKNPKLDTKTIGKKELTFKYITDEDLKVPYTIKYEVVDNVPPIISLSKYKNVTVGSNIDLPKSIFCGDNYDDTPKCIIEGEYDLNKVGEYPLTFKGIDSSNNEVSNNFTLYVNPKKSPEKEVYTETLFTDVVENYKNENTKIGLDVSHWQGNINFQQVKDAGVEFVYIRVGRGDGIGEDFVMDTKFEQNIKGFNEVGIPVGVYFYTYAASEKDAIKEAKWVVDKIKDYKVDLEVVFDWENWSFYQEFNLSFYHLTEMVKAWNKELKKHNYQGMLYSSKNYLENEWFPVDMPIWLAHYTKETTYQGKYKVWQLCADGVVKGIPDNQVDINVMYIKEKNS